MSQETERQILAARENLQRIMQHLDAAEQDGFNTIIVTGKESMKLAQAMALLGGLRITGETTWRGRPGLWVQRGTKEKPP